MKPLKISGFLISSKRKQNPAVLPDTSALVVDEAHKLPETARQMFGVTLEKEDIRSLTNSLRCERYVLAAESLGNAAAPLLRKLAHPPDGRPFEHYAGSLAAPERSLTVIQRQLHGLLTPPTRGQLESVSSAVTLFHQGHSDMVFYPAEDSRGGPSYSPPPRWPWGRTSAASKRKPAC